MHMPAWIQRLGIPMKNHKAIWFSAILARIPWNVTKLPGQHSMLGHYRHASERPLKCRLLVGRWGLVLGLFGSSRLLKQKKIVRIGPPLIKLSGFAQTCIISFIFHAVVPFNKNLVLLLVLDVVYWGRIISYRLDNLINSPDSPLVTIISAE